MIRMLHMQAIIVFRFEFEICVSMAPLLVHCLMPYNKRMKRKTPRQLNCFFSLLVRRKSLCSYNSIQTIIDVRNWPEQATSNHRMSYCQNTTTRDRLQKNTEIFCISRIATSSRRIRPASLAQCKKHMFP